MKTQWIGVAAALGSALSWALGAIVFKKIGEGLSSSLMTLLKSLISVVLLGALLALSGFERLSAESFWMLCASGVLGIAAGDTLFFAALKRLSPHTLIVLFTGGQALTVLLAVVFLQERPGVSGWAGIALILVGIFLVLRANLGGDEHGSQGRGVVLGVLSVLCMSVSLVGAKKALAVTGSVEATFVRMLAGAVAMAVFSLCRWRKLTGQPLPSVRLFAHFVLGVGVITFGGFWLSLLSIKSLELSLASALNSAEPLFVFLLGVCCLRERVKLPALLGTVAAVAGVICICLSLQGG